MLGIISRAARRMAQKSAADQRRTASLKYGVAQSSYERAVSEETRAKAAIFAAPDNDKAILAAIREWRKARVETAERKAELDALRAKMT